MARPQCSKRGSQHIFTGGVKYHSRSVETPETGLKISFGYRENAYLVDYWIKPHGYPVGQVFSLRNFYLQRGLNGS
jgi:hypothetical protein